MEQGNFNTTPNKNICSKPIEFSQPQKMGNKALKTMANVKRKGENPQCHDLREQEQEAFMWIKLHKETAVGYFER